MAPHSANRFALFADEYWESSPPEETAHNNPSPFVNQVADTDEPWQEVKRGVQSQGQKLKTLVIRNEVKRPSATARPKQRDISNPVQPTDRHDDPHENWCGVCNHRFPTKGALLAHTKQSPNHSNYCNLCKRVFKDRNGLQNHLDHSQGHETFCNLCLSAFKDHWGLKNHFENNYAVGHEFICLTCLLGFHRKGDLDKHLQTGAKHVVCNTCHRNFRTQDERDAHWINTMKHKHCLQPGCDFDAPSANVLETHMQDDHFRCEGCKLVFPSQTKLTQHSETCKFDIACQMCDEPCAGLAKLMEHVETCFCCVHCDFRTTHESIYQIHKAKHTGALTCWFCTTSLSGHSELLAHLESGSCPSFSDPTLLLTCLGKWWFSALYMDLDVHAQIRRNEIDLHEAVSWMEQSFLHPFICRTVDCGKTFAQLSELIAHVEEEKCNWCLDHLRMDWLKEELKRDFTRRDSVLD